MIKKAIIICFIAFLLSLIGFSSVRAASIARYKVPAWWGSAVSVASSETGSTVTILYQSGNAIQFWNNRVYRIYRRVKK